MVVVVGAALSRGAKVHALSLSLDFILQECNISHKPNPTRALSQITNPTFEKLEIIQAAENESNSGFNMVSVCVLLGFKCDLLLKQIKF